MSDPSRNWLDRLRDMFVRPPSASPEGNDGGSSPRRLRIGIDVGGTFTHAVALDATTLAIVSRVKVPTTHAATEGVAAGVVGALSLLLSDAGVRPEEVGLIAHSTTQATNALLEGDVAQVGILGLGSGAGAWLARRATRVGNLELSPGRYLRTFHCFLNFRGGLDDAALERAISDLEEAGAQAYAVSGAFGVDDTEAEARAVAMLRAQGKLACAGHEISQLYGLRARTRTAALNASMLPKMVETADLTERAVRAAGITAPLMVMRSDGGVMTLDEMRRRPILTMLSGPAAGVAAAMMYVRLSDGLFLEVGGTSTDISAIRNGKAQVQAAQLGGNRLYLRTLDVRTVGEAGGSMIRASGNGVHAIGPRSAHIAGLSYAAFPASDMKMGEIVEMAPRPGDPPDYLAVRTGRDVTHAVTTTCAANFLGLVPQGDCAQGDREQIHLAMERVGRHVGMAPDALAERILQLATDPLAEVVDQLLAEYKLDRRLVTLMGGGGGAAALVPFLARRLGLRFALADNADVISAIGVALAMVRETLERNIPNPTNDDLLRLRREAEAAVLAMGAAPGTVEVQIEIDAAKNIVRALATGATELRTRDPGAAGASVEEARKVAAHSLGEPVDLVELLAQTDGLQVWGAHLKDLRLGGLSRRERTAIRVVDRDGVIRLQASRGAVAQASAGQAPASLRAFIEAHARFGDGGKEIPDCFVLRGLKILDLSGLLNSEQVVSLAAAELEGVPPDQPVVILGSLRR